MKARQLRNSILQMAIQGKLVPQDPNDEPASVLLERIRAEKERLIAEGKIKKEKNPSRIFRGADNTHYEIVGNNPPVSIEDEIPFEIPENWAWVRLGKISTYDETKKKVRPKDAPPTTWGLDLEDIEKGGRILVRRSVSERKAIGEKVVFSKGDILYSKLRPYLLKILVAPDDGICTSEIVPFRVFDEINPFYIVYFLKSPEIDSLVNSSTFGIKMPRVGVDTMTSLLVPLPPKAEQKRIVAKIEELQPFIDEYDHKETELIRLNADFPEALKKSILQEAVMGKLVPQDPDDEPASVLLDRIRAEKERLIAEGKIKRDKNESRIYKRDNSYYENQAGKERCIDEELLFEIPDSWTWTRLGIIGNWQSGSTPPRNNSEYYGGSIPWLKTGDLNDGYINYSSETITEKALNERKLHLNSIGSILIAMYGATIGKLGILNISSTTNQACCACLPILISNKYLFYFLMSQKKHFTERAEGGAQPNISKEKIVATLFPLPPLAEQKRIVAKIESSLKLAEKLRN